MHVCIVKYRLSSFVCLFVFVFFYLLYDIFLQNPFLPTKYVIIGMWAKDGFPDLSPTYYYGDNKWGYPKWGMKRKKKTKQNKKKQFVHLCVS